MRLWGCVNGCGALWDAVGPYERLRDPTGGCGAMWEMVGSCGRLWDCRGGCGACLVEVS